MNVVDNIAAYKAAEKEADQGLSFGQCALNHLGNSNQCIGEYAPAQRGPWLISHPTLVLMPVVRLLDIVFQRMKGTLATVSEQISKLLKTQEDLSTQARTNTANIAQNDAKISALSKRIDAQSNRIDDSTLDSTDTSRDEVARLREEMLRRDAENEKRIAEIEQRHAAQIRALQLAVSHLSTQKDGTSTAANSLRSLSDDEFESPYSSDTEK